MQIKESPMRIVPVPLVTLAALTSIVHAGEPSMNKTEHTKQIARAYLEAVWDKGDIAAIDALVTPDYRGQTQATGQPLAEGPAGLRAWVTRLRTAFPDHRKVVRSLIAEGDRVVALVGFSGTFKASGKPVAQEQVYVLTLRGDRVASEAVYFDVGGMLKQVSPETARPQ
jgi:steroid delta-isomerase-like uncharacterized protein